MSDAPIAQITVSNGPSRPSALIQVTVEAAELENDLIVSADQINRLRLLGCSSITGHCRNNTNADIAFHVFALVGNIESYHGEFIVAPSHPAPIIGTAYPLAHTSYRISLKRNPTDLVIVPSVGSAQFGFLGH